MICFRDTTYCNAPHHTKDCQRRWTRELANQADLWWRTGGGKPGEAPVAFADFCTQRLNDDAEEQMQP